MQNRRIVTSNCSLGRMPILITVFPFTRYRFHSITMKDLWIFQHPFILCLLPTFNSFVVCFLEHYIDVNDSSRLMIPKGTTHIRLLWKRWYDIWLLGVPAADVGTKTDNIIGVQMVRECMASNSKHKKI